MNRRYDYKCICCGTIIEKKHKIEETLTKAYCPTCKDSTSMEKLISKSTFKIGWDTNY